MSRSESATYVIVNYLCQYGAAALIDPMWDVDLIVNRSKQFRAVFNNLKEQPPTYGGRIGESAGLMRFIVNVIGSDQLSAYVASFLGSNDAVGRTDADPDF